MKHDISTTIAQLATDEVQFDEKATPFDVTAAVDDLFDLADQVSSCPPLEIIVDTISSIGVLDDVEQSRPSSFYALSHGALLQTALAGVEIPTDDARPLLAGILPAALEAGRSTGAKDTNILRSTAIGLTAAIRVRELLSADKLRPWDPLGLVQGIGAAIAAAHGLGLDAQQSLHALGIASTQATGTQQAQGTDAAIVLTGLGSANGLEAAVLAAHGIDGPAKPIDGRRGLLAVMHPDAEDSISEAYAEILHQAETAPVYWTPRDKPTTVLRDRYVKQLRAYLR